MMLPARRAAPSAKSRIDAGRNPNRRSADHNLDRWRPAWARRCNRHIRARRGVHDHARKSNATLTGPIFQLAPRIPAPSKQLLRRQPVPARNRAHRLTARVAFGDNPRLLLRRPIAPAPSTSEHFQPAYRLRLSQKLSV